MSRYYGMSVTVNEFDLKRLNEIEKAISTEWPFDPDLWQLNDTAFCGYGESNLCGGETEDDFSRRLAKAIFVANGGPCSIQVEASFLESPPTESYFFKTEEYDELMRQKIEPESGGAPPRNDT